MTLTRSKELSTNGRAACFVVRGTKDLSTRTSKLGSMRKRLPIKSWRTTTLPTNSSTSSIDRTLPFATTSRRYRTCSGPVPRDHGRRPSDSARKSVGRRRPAGCDPTPTRRLHRRRTRPTVKLEGRRCICRRCGAGACTSSGATCPTATKLWLVRMALGGRLPPGAGLCRTLALRGGRGRRLVVRCCTNCDVFLLFKTPSHG